MTYGEIESLCRSAGLDISGAFHPTPEDTVPETCETLILLSPLEPGFWASFQQSPEYLDGGADPIDLWSTRVISDLAKRLEATPLFPFGGPPYQSFIAWALSSGRAWASPLELLVHDTAGLFASYRGALAFERTIHLPAPPLMQSPCTTCADKPCLTSCPADVLNQNGYDIPGCHNWLASPQGEDCMNGGCAVRRSCPVSQSYGRVEAQSAHHMRAFQGE